MFGCFSFINDLTSLNSVHYLKFSNLEIIYFMATNSLVLILIAFVTLPKEPVAISDNIL